MGQIKNFSFSYDEITTYDIIDVYEKPQELNFPKKNVDNIEKFMNNDIKYIYSLNLYNKIII